MAATTLPGKRCRYAGSHKACLQVGMRATRVDMRRAAMRLHRSHSQNFRLIKSLDDTQIYCPYLGFNFLRVD